MSEVHVQILEEAKLQLESTEYTCIAIKRSSNSLGFLDGYYPCYNREKYKEEHYPTYQLLEYISSAIYPESVVDIWLETKHGIIGTSEEMYDYRLAWIANMIEYWRDKE